MPNDPPPPVFVRPSSTLILLTSIPSAERVRHVSLHTDGTVSPKSTLFCKPPHTSWSELCSHYTQKNTLTICNAWTPTVVGNHRLGERLFPETVVFTVEWCHLLFAVCVQLLHLQLVVTETHTCSIMWQEVYSHSPWYRLADIVWQCRLQQCLPLSSWEIPQ